MTRVPLPLILPSNISLLPSIIGLYLPVELLMCVFSCPASTKESGLRGRHLWFEATCRGNERSCTVVCRRHIRSSRVNL